MVSWKRSHPPQQPGHVRCGHRTSILDSFPAAGKAVLMESVRGGQKAQCQKQTWPLKLSSGARQVLPSGFRATLWWALWCGGRKCARFPQCSCACSSAGRYRGLGLGEGLFGVQERGGCRQGRCISHSVCGRLPPSRCCSLGRAPGGLGQPFLSGFHPWAAGLCLRGPRAISST